MEGKNGQKSFRLLPGMARVPGAVAAAYAVLAALWILFSDRLLETFVPDLHRFSQVQTLKGFLFVLVTTWFLYTFTSRNLAPLQRQSERLQQLAMEIGGASRKAFFPSLVRGLAETLQVELAAVGEVDGESATTLSVWRDGREGDRDTFPLAGTPVEEAIRNRGFRIAEGAAARLPLLPDAQALAAVALLDAAGNTAGFLLVSSRRPMADPAFARSILLFAGVRAAAELERKRWEESRIAQFRQTATILDSIPAVISVADPAGKLLFLNRFGSALYGSAWGGKGRAEIFGWSGSAPEGEEEETTSEHRDERSGRWYRCIERTIRWTDGSSVSLEVALDITEQRDLEQMKDGMLSAVSHEMRTPLTAILGFTELLLEQPDMDREQRQGCLDTVRAETERLTELISNFLDLQRIRSRLVSYFFRPLQLAQLLEEGAALFAASSPAHRFTVRAADLPPVRGDEERLRQVLSNLLSNAVKYSPQGGDIRVEGRREGEFVVVTVQDRGVGLSAEAAEQIFDRFYRVDNTDTRRSGGAGLGLALVKEIVTAHGGEVGVKSAEGVGSSFSFSVPIAGEEAGAR